MKGRGQRAAAGGIVLVVLAVVLALTWKLILFGLAIIALIALLLVAGFLYLRSKRSGDRR